MSLRRRADKREIIPDPKFGDGVLTKFMNSIMYQGKKSAAESPATVDHVLKEDQINHITLTDDAIQRLALATAPVTVEPVSRFHPDRPADVRIDRTAVLRQRERRPEVDPDLRTVRACRARHATEADDGATQRHRQTSSYCAAHSVLPPYSFGKFLTLPKRDP